MELFLFEPPLTKGGKDSPPTPLLMEDAITCHLLSMTNNSRKRRERNPCRSRKTWLCMHSSSCINHNPIYTSRRRVNSRIDFWCRPTRDLFKWWVRRFGAADEKEEVWYHDVTLWSDDCRLYSRLCKWGGMTLQKHYCNFSSPSWLCYIADKHIMLCKSICSSAAFSVLCKCFLLPIKCVLCHLIRGIGLLLPWWCTLLVNEGSSLLSCRHACS